MKEISISEKFSIPGDLAGPYQKANLGTFITGFKQNNTITGTIGSILIPLIGIIFLVIGVLSLMNVIPLWNKDREAGMKSFLIIMGLVLTSFSFWGLLPLIRSLHEQYHLYSEGLVHVKNAKKGKFTILRWEEIDKVFQSSTAQFVNGAYQGTSYFYTLVDKNGAVIKFGDWNRDGFGEIVRNKLTERLFIEAITCLQKGRTASFGPLTASSNRIATSKNSLEWKDISEVRLIKGTLNIYIKGNNGKNKVWKTFKVYTIANILALLNLMILFLGDRVKTS